MHCTPLVFTAALGLALSLTAQPASAQMPMGSGGPGSSPQSTGAGFIEPGFSPMPAAQMSTMQCLQAQNDWIDDCLDGWWTSLTGQLDDCIEEFDQSYPECAQNGVSAVDAAQEVHDAYGARGEIIGGGLGLVGGVAIDLVHCVGGAFEGVYVLTEAGWIVVGGGGYGDYSISDEELEAAAAACWNTAGNAAIIGTAIVRPEIIAVAAVADLGYQASLCADACLNSSDPYECTQACYEGLGAHASALMGFLGIGHVAGQVLPPEFFAPDAFGIRLRPGAMDGHAVEDSTEGPECLDEAFTEFRFRLGDPDYQPGVLEDYGFSGPEYLQGQLELLNLETTARFGGQWTLQAEGLSQAEMIGIMESAPVGSHGMAAGHGHPVEVNHAIYLFRGPGGVTPFHANGYPWPMYDLYLYAP